MTNKELNKVERDKLLDAVREAGLDVVEQSAYFKCTYGDSPAKIYVAKTQKVTRIDLSGFTLKRDGIVQISREEAKELKLGSVQAQIDFTQSEETVLEALTKAAEALKEVPPREKKAASKKEKAQETAASTDETEETSNEEDDKAARRQAIKQAAERMAGEAAAQQ